MQSAPAGSTAADRPQEYATQPQAAGAQDASLGTGARSRTCRCPSIASARALDATGNTAQQPAGLQPDHQRTASPLLGSAVAVSVPGGARTSTTRWHDQFQAMVSQMKRVSTARCCRRPSRDDCGDQPAVCRSRVAIEGGLQRVETERPKAKRGRLSPKWMPRWPRGDWRTHRSKRRDCLVA